MERARRIGGALLRADDPHALSRWYAEHLGLEATREESQGVALFAAQPGSSTSELSLEVDDLDAIVDQLRAAGVHVDVDDDWHPEGLVPDGRPTRDQPQMIARAEAVLPGPRPNQVWLHSNREDGGTLTLATLSGGEAGRSITVPPGFWAHSTDYRGGVLVGGVGGEYLVDHTGVHRIATGAARQVPVTVNDTLGTNQIAGRPRVTAVAGLPSRRQCRWR